MKFETEVLIFHGDDVMKKLQKFFSFFDLEMEYPTKNRDGFMVRAEWPNLLAWTRLHVDPLLNKEPEPMDHIFLNRHECCKIWNPFICSLCMQRIAEQTSQQRCHYLPASCTWLHNKIISPRPFFLHKA